MRKLSRLCSTQLTLTISLLTLTACPGTRTGNPYTSNLIVTASAQEASLAQNLKEQSSLWAMIQNLFIASAWSLTPPASMTDASGNFTISLSEAWVVLTEIKFEKDESGESDTESSVKGSYTVDLFDTTPEALGAVALDEGPYKRIKFKFEHEESLSSGAPAELGNNSLYLSGSINGNSFSYQAADGSEVEIGGSNGIVPSSTADLVLLFRFADLVKKINFTALNAEGNRAVSDDNRVSAANACPLIDSSAEDIFTCFRKGLESTANFGKDRDGDSDLDEDEDKVRD